MKISFFLFLSIFPALVFAQQKPVEGIVFDKETRDRIAKVHVLNLNSGKSVYNTFKGEFSIDAQPGDY